MVKTESKLFKLVDEMSGYNSLPPIDKKSDVGRYLYNFGQTQCLHQPWYARHYKFWGKPFEKLNRSFFFMVSAFTAIILILLIIIPSIGLISIPYPISTTQNIRISKSEQIFPNTVISNTSFLSKGNEISYVVRSNYPFSFAIWDKPFKDFSATENYYQSNHSFINVIMTNTYKMFPIFLHKGDSVSYFFNSTNTESTSFTRFFITNSPKFDVSYRDKDFKSTLNGTFISQQSQNYYFGIAFYGNGENTRTVVSGSFAYNVSGTDLSNAYVSDIRTSNITENTFSVPKSGNYNFYIYFDPQVAFSNSTSAMIIHYTIIFHQQLNARDNWLHVTRILEISFLIMGIFMLIAYYQHVYARKFERAKKIYYSDFTLNRACYQCRELVLENQIKCTFCGKIFRE